MIRNNLSQPATRVDADAPMTTKVYPRTLEQAFGPYHRSGSAWIVPMDDKLQSEFNASTYVLGFILAVVVIAVCWGAV